ncbi:MAG TPA: alanine/glycine:cation symporter family protein [Woeseiaceae bacterium]|nr:alanine/glycine:cation symporter family protein [Woeseiaceae bacterium]
MRLIHATIFLLLLATVPAAAAPSSDHWMLAQASADEEAAPAVAAPEEPPEGVMKAADDAMGAANAVVGAVLFFDVAFWDDTVAVPFIVLWLVAGGIFLTFRMGFFNLRGFRHAIALVRGKYTDPNEPGDVSHFQALSCALSATVGLGNIAGVAIAITLGGPGATFWMIVAGLIGMTTKFTECTLAVMYREFRADSHVLGGPVQYLSKGFAERGLPRFGKALAILFAFLCIGGSIAGGNAFQVNQSMNAVQESIPGLQNWVYGLVMTVLVGLVIIGGIRRIARVTEKVVPFMAIFYVFACLFIILTNAELVPAAFSRIFTEAFSPDAAFGGLIGVLVVGFQRAAFSNEAGAGSAAIAHSAARTNYPVREGTVALLEPFIDTVVICTMTALVINITGAYNNPAYADVIQTAQGAALTSRAFGEHLPWFTYVLSLAVFLFAYSTILSWSYYGERCTVWLFGERASKYYKVLLLSFTFLGSVITAINVLAFGDLMILGMSLPNLIGVYLLHGKVRAALTDYWERYKAGEFPMIEANAGARASSAPAAETKL